MTDTKRKFTVYYSWEMCGEIAIEANSVDEAIKIVETETKLSRMDSHYLMGSFEVNLEDTYSENGEVLK